MLTRPSGGGDGGGGDGGGSGGGGSGGGGSGGGGAGSPCGVPVLTELPSAAAFFADYVLPSRPCVLRLSELSAQRWAPLRDRLTLASCGGGAATGVCRSRAWPRDAKGGRLYLGP